MFVETDTAAKRIIITLITDTDSSCMRISTEPWKSFRAGGKLILPSG